MPSSRRRKTDPMEIVEEEIVLRRFDGINLLVDQAFLGPTYLKRAQNWIPGDTFRLTKAPGNLSFEGGDLPDDVLKMISAYADGKWYLYAVVEDSSGDQLWVSEDDGSWTQVEFAGGGDAVFDEVGSVYDMEIMNGFLYVGNGIDPIQRVEIGGDSVELAAIASFTDNSAAATLVADSGAQFLTGTYSYAWAIFDNTAGVWLERGQTRTFVVSTTGDRAVTFPTPTNFATNSGTLTSQYRAHLFVAPINLPIEFAHDQNPNGSSAAGTVTLRLLTAAGPPIPLQGDARTGRMLRAHRGRLYVSGDQTNKDAVWATAVVVPGLEQTVFNAGAAIFFPYNARLPRIYQDITGIALAGTGRDDPDAPLVVTGLTSTYLFFGDIIDDPSAYWVQVSRTVGCIGRESMVETPHGVFFIGRESVYVIPPGGGAPQDVGWPIRPAIQGIPTVGRPLCRVLYHKGFLKVAIVPSGATTPISQYWLDLRQGISQIPSWWGPHPRAALTAWCVGDQDPSEPDRGFVAYPTGVVELLHQNNTYTENDETSRIISTLQTGDLDNNAPLDRKLFTRVRVTAFPVQSTSLSVGLSVDGGAVGSWGAMTIPGAGGAQWDDATWNVSTWGQFFISEGESVSPANRPRGRTASLQLIHSDNNALSLRDFELRYLPIPRPVRSIDTDPLS